MPDRVQAACPCCSALLTIDTQTGEILGIERPKVDASKTFDQAMKEVRGGAQRRQEAFDKAFARTQHLDDLLQKKFEEARKKAAKDPAGPVNPFDLD